MFQQTIQDVLALAEASSDAVSLLERLRERIASVEPFEGGELVAHTSHGFLRFVFDPGLGEVGAKALAALGDEPTLRVDTLAELQERGLGISPGFNSLLVLRVGAPGATSAAILLSHPRAWSFAAAPLSRIRTIAGVALRLLLAGSSPAHSSEEVRRLKEEVPRLRAHVTSLEDEIISLRADRARKDSDKPQ